MKILITGGTGFVGSALCQRLLSQGHEVTIVGRSAKSCERRTPHAALHCLSADTRQPGSWQGAVAEQDALINLAGRSVFTLWTEAAKKDIRDSRILTTRNLVNAIPAGSNMTLLSTSAAGYYGDGGERELIEESPAGQSFLARICQEWETEANLARDKGARVAIMRFGVVLGQGGGALATMKTPFSLGLGGPLGSGNQWFPWIRLDDLVAAALFLLDCATCQGPFNFVAPQQVRQKEFAHSLAAALNKPALLPIPAFAVRLALGEFGQSLLQGQKVLPRALGEKGFVFANPQLAPALESLVRD